MMTSPIYLLAVAALGIVGLLFLVIRVRLEPFVALLLVSAIVALAAGIPLGKIVPTMEEGVGKVLAHVAAIVGLGAMLGKMLELSGGAQTIADYLVRLFGEKRAPFALGLTGLIFGVPVFFDVGIIVTAPIVYAAAFAGRKGMLYYALPLGGGLAIVHGLLPPHPGPVAAAGLLGANIGLVMLFGGICVGPAWSVGYLYARWIAKRVIVPLPDYIEQGFRDEYVEGSRPVGDTPVSVGELGTGGSSTKVEPRTSLVARESQAPPVGLGTVTSIIGLPIVLILVQTFTSILIADKDNPIRVLFSFIGAPLIALLIALLVAFYVLGVRRGWSKEHLATVAENALRPVGMILLVVGAGAVFGTVLVASGIGTILAEGLTSTGLPLIVLAFLVAYAVRIAQGSATVATVTAAGIVAGLVEQANLSAIHLALIVVAIGAGAISTSHVNDAGFWLFSRLYGVSEKDSLKSFTVMTTLMGFTSFATVAGLSVIL